MSVRAYMFALVAAGCLAGCGGCGDEPEPAPKEVAEKAPAPDAGPQVHPLLTKRQAFGLPMPPEVVAVRESDGVVIADTPMSLDELESFYRQHLVDYEYFRPATYRLDIVGLYEHMPRIRIMDGGRRRPTSVRYLMPVFKKPPQTGELADGEPPEPKPKPKPQPGDPVDTRTADGKLLAPGARYGRPYTPPPESPLYQERFRANFGKPFGEWQLN